MIIAAIEALRLEEFANLIWVTVEDADGNSGVGETFFGAEAVEAYLHETAAPELVGREISGPEELRGRLRPYVGHQPPGVEMRGNSDVDIALWDLWGGRPASHSGGCWEDGAASGSGPIRPAPATATSAPHGARIRATGGWVGTAAGPMRTSMPS